MTLKEYFLFEQMIRNGSRYVLVFWFIVLPQQPYKCHCGSTDIVRDKWIYSRHVRRYQFEEGGWYWMTRTIPSYRERYV